MEEESTMKKILLIMLSLLIVTSLCACANPSGTYDPEDTKVANGSTSDVTTTDAPLTEETTAEIPEEDPVFSVEASLAAIDKMASENFAMNLQYDTLTLDNLRESFRGNIGQVDGKFWASVSSTGSAILEEEGGYYHKYIIDFSKWTYYFTYEMSNKEEYDKVFNGRYWWKNYLDELTFDAYDELAYVGIEQILEQDCYIFAFDGIVTDVGQVKLNLYVNKANNNVMKMEISIKYSGTRHCEDVTDATIQALYVQIGDEATSPRLPNPRWDPPTDQ